MNVFVFLLYHACSQSPSPSNAPVADSPAPQNNQASTVRPPRPPNASASPPHSRPGQANQHHPKRPPPPPGQRKKVSPSGTGIFTKEAPASPQPVATDAALCAGCDIIFISVCSLRKDHVGIFTDKLDLTPTIDKLGKSAFQFQQAYAASNFTLAGLTAILTARFGSATGVISWDRGLGKGYSTLPEVLGFYGYNTAAFTVDAASGFRPDYGLDRGFQHMEIIKPPAGTPDGRTRTDKVITGATAVPLAKWLAEQPKNKPVFAMLHTRSAHYPFVISKEETTTDQSGLSSLLYASGLDTAAQSGLPGMKQGTQSRHAVGGQADPIHGRFRELGIQGERIWRDLYKRSVKRVDDDVKVVLEAIKKRGRAKNTIIVLVADHGESLNDHGEMLHGEFYYQSVINVPLLIHLPKSKQRKSWLKNNQKINAMVSHVDIMPTLLELVGATKPANIDGQSMLSLMQGRKQKIRQIALSEGGPTLQNPQSPQGAVLSYPWALLRQPYGTSGTHRPSKKQQILLFNIADDPQQKNNVADKHPKLAQSLLSRWQQYRQQNQTQQSIPLQLSPAFIKELQANGYNFRPLENASKDSD